jgi:hypothetical protein
MLNEPAVAAVNQNIRKPSIVQPLIRSKTPIDSYTNEYSIPKSCSILPGKLVNFDALSSKSIINNKISQISSKSCSSSMKKNQNYLDLDKLPAFCFEMIDSNQWIKKYGLRTNKLTFNDILSMLGFKKSQGKHFDLSL